MTKIGADVNGKPADPGSLERGISPPVVVQSIPEKVSTRSPVTITVFRALRTYTRSNTFRSVKVDLVKKTPLTKNVTSRGGNFTDTNTPIVDIRKPQFLIRNISNVLNIFNVLISYSLISFC